MLLFSTSTLKVLFSMKLLIFSFLDLTEPVGNNFNDYLDLACTLYLEKTPLSNTVAPFLIYLDESLLSIPDNYELFSGLTIFNDDYNYIACLTISSTDYSSH